MYKYLHFIIRKDVRLRLACSGEIRLIFHFNLLQELDERIKDVRGKKEETESRASTCENVLEKLPVLLHNVSYKFLMHQVII